MIDELGKAEPRQKHFDRGFVFNIVTLLIVLFAAFLGFREIQNFSETATVFTEESRRNTALNCDVQAGIGITVDVGCNDPAIAKYRDPNLKVGSSASARTARETQRLICQVFLKVYPEQIAGTNCITILTTPTP